MSYATFSPSNKLLICDGRPSSEQMTNRLLAFLKSQLQRTADPLKLHNIQSFVRRMETGR